MTKVNEAKVMKKELEERITALTDALIDLNEGTDEDLDKEKFLLFLEGLIDTLSEGIEVIEAVRIFCLDDMAGKKEGAQISAKEQISEDLVRIAEMLACFGQAAETRNDEKFTRYSVIESVDEELPDATGQEKDPTAIISFGQGGLRVLPFTHILRICPWLNDRSVMRSVPGAKDVYYLFEEGSQVKIGEKFWLVGPIVVIRLNDDQFLQSPNSLDLHRVRKFIKDNTESVVFQEGAAYPALRFV